MTNRSRGKSRSEVLVFADGDCVLREHDLRRTAMIGFLNQHSGMIPVPFELKRWWRRAAKKGYSQRFRKDLLSYHPSLILSEGSDFCRRT